MSKTELAKAVKIVTEDKVIPDQDLSIFMCFALPTFKPVVCTLQLLASLISYQCLQMNGALDMQALNEIAVEGKRKFIIVG